MNSTWPCPCCGHLTLPQGPGDYELCPVCFWEDDGTQLRWPMSPDGANGVSLVDAQGTYAQHGAMHRQFRRKVRRARRNEPLDPGWRPFDPALDWTDPTLPGERWPKNREALYYWRTTYWDGDPDRLPAAPSEITGGDRLVEHLRITVPETQSVIESLEWQYGRAGGIRVCGLVADLAIGAYRDGDSGLGLRITAAMLPALDESSALFAPNCVVIGFLENEAWHEPGMQPFIEQWPDELRAEIQRQREWSNQATSEMERRAQEWTDLWSTSTGRPVDLIVRRLKELRSYETDDPRSELGVQLNARVLSDRRWLYKHPVDALKLAWHYRAVRSPLHTLNWLRRPRFAG